MSLDRNDVEKIAHLARLSIDEADIAGYASDLTSILALVDQMQAKNTKNVEPMANPHDAVQRLREDVTTEGNLRDHLQTVAPSIENGHFLVPRVIE